MNKPFRVEWQACAPSFRAFGPLFTWYPPKAWCFVLYCGWWIFKCGTAGIYRPEDDKDD